MRLEQLEAAKDDPDPKALCCHGLLRGDTGGLLVRFVDGRPVSQVTEDFLGWTCQRLGSEGKKALLLVWDNASWHVSQRARSWICALNRRVKREGGVRIVACRLPIKSSWLNPIEPCWIHGKRAILEPAFGEVVRSSKIVLRRRAVLGGRWLLAGMIAERP